MILSRYSYVSAALRDPRFDIPGGSPAEADHRAMREQALELYAPARWRANFSAEAEKLAEGLEGEVELVRDFVQPWAFGVAALVTGVPKEFVPVLLPFAQAVFDAGAAPDDATLAGHSSGATARLAGAYSAREAPLHVQAFVALTISLPAFMGNAFLALLDNPVQQAFVREKTAVDELLRFAGPSLIQRRVARERFQLLDLTVNARQRVELRLAEANHDGEEFPDPDRLDLRRSAAGHVALGAGAHACVGGPLIRAATTAMFDSVADRLLPRLELLGAEPYGGPAIRGHRVRVLVKT